jgi:MAM domain, meprin/A5/mu
MLLHSADGGSGTQVALVSPQKNFENSMQLSFRYHMWLNETDAVASLKVYRYSSTHTFDQILFNASGNHGVSWQTVTVCLPNGTYSLAFLGTVGLRFLSDIAVADVVYSMSIKCSSTNVTAPEVTGNGIM